MVANGNISVFVMHWFLLHRSRLPHQRTWYVT